MTTILIGIAIGLLIILGVRILVVYGHDWLVGILASLLRLLPAASPALSVAPTSTISSATYTELFSGVGFDDAVDTSAYEDHLATTIYLTPAFTVTSTAATFTPAPASPRAPIDLTGTVRQEGDTYVANIPAFPNVVITSSYPGILRFGYDPATNRVLIVYAAFESRVLEVGPTDGGTSAQVIADYSSRFGSRVFSGGSFGSRGIDPVIFSHGGAWWIFSGDGSERPVLMKIQNDAVIDYGGTAFSGETSLQAAPGPTPHEIYVQGSSGSYVLTDNGFKQAPVQWESSALNQWVGDVTDAKILSVEASPEPSYFLSNDGGKTWTAATPGQQIAFTNPGGDFRFKIELPVPQGDPYASPWVHVIRLAYSVRINNP